MKKWIWISLGIIVLLLWLAIDIYTTVQADKKFHLTKYEQLVPDTYVIEDAQRFHGEERYTVFTVVTEQEKEAFFYVSEDAVTYEIDFEDIHLSSEDAIQKAKKEYPDITEIIRVTPAYSGRDFTWEIIAQDEQERYQYVYYSMTKGTFQKRFTLTK